MKNIIQRPLLRGDWIGGRYRVESYLGTGSIGSVYIVSDFLQENRIKALKFIPHRTLSDEDLHYLSKRIRILHKLNVRGILTALEQGADENGLYFTMEYLESPSLGSVSDTLSDYEITCLLYELSGILAQLHEFKFLHRRLHPNNLFLRVTNFHAPMHPQPIVTVTDAGLSLPHLLSHYSIFIAPELHEGGFHDIQTELYSFGILAYALYHRILNQTLQLQQIVQSHSTFVEWKNQQISKDISTLILRCINRDPKLRPFDFREVETTLYRNLQTKPSPKALPISSVFVGRGNEFRYFSIRLQDVQHQKQWAILIQGENESGKSRLMDEFAIEHQLKGKFAVRLDKENISPLLKLFPHHRAITLQSSDLFSYVSENLEKLLKEKVLPFPLLICWHNFDQLPEEGYLFFKQLLILKKDFPILWLLEGRNPIPNLDTLGHSERFNRYPLPPLQPKELEKFIGNYLHYASGYQSLTRQLVQYFGTKPGWLINALQILLEKKAITYELGRFHIHPLEIEKLLRSGQLSPAVDLTQLSPLAKTILQWMSVYRLPLTEDQLNSIFGIDDLELRNAMNLLTYKGYLVQSGIYYQFRLPAMMDSVFRTIPEYRLKQIYGWIAQWQERNFRDQPTALELWTIAKSYFAAGERNAFLRVFETLLERFGNKIDITFPEEILWSALQEKRSPLSLVNQFRTLRILYRQYFRTKNYTKALEICNIVSSRHEYSNFFHPYWLLNRYGTCYLALSDYSNAKIHFEKSIQLWDSKNIKEYITAIRGLAYCFQYLDLTEVGYKTLITYRKAIETVTDPQLRYQEFNTYAILLLQYNKRIDARFFLEDLIEKFPASLIEEKINAIIQLIKIYIRNGDLNSFETYYNKYKSFIFKVGSSYQQLVFKQYYIIFMIQKGQLRKVSKEIEDSVELAKIHYTPQNQCNMLIDWSDGFYFLGDFRKALFLLKQAMLLINRTKLELLRVLTLVKIENVLQLLGYKTKKLLHLIKKLTVHNKNNILLIEYAYEICSTFIDDDEIKNNILSLYNFLNKNINLESHYPVYLVKLLFFRSSLNNSIKNNLSIQKQFEEYERHLILITEPFDKALYLHELLLCSTFINPQKVTDYYRMLIHHLDKLNAFWLKIKVLIQYGIYLHSIQKYHECKVHWNEAKILCSQLGISFENLIPELVTIDSEKEENEVPLLVQCLTSIRQMITLLNEVENKDRFLEKFLKEIILGLGATTGQVFTLNEKTNSLHKRPTIKYGRELPPLQLYDLAQLTFHTQKYQLLHKQVENYGSRGRLTAVGFPILTQNKPVAVVTIQFEHETYNTEWIETYLEVLLQIMEQSPFQELLSDQLPTNMYLPSNQSIVSQSYYGLIGQSAAMQEVYGLLELLKGKDYPVLILGESGTGKELVSKIIHTHSTRANGPYYAINCASIPENLIESELFGHTKGAFTGADQPKDGFFTLANTGTIFLDEINQISLSMQGKMLRVLQEGEYYPVGSTKLKKTDVRIICAGKPELLTLIKDGQFREDFYYRINVIEIRLPSLRERKEDIPLLVTHFIKQLNETNQNKSIYIKGIRKQALDVLMNYDFPGNVRELKNAITFATLHLKFSGYIEVDHLPKEILLNNQNTLLKNSFQQSISEFERKLILQTLNRTNWNRTLTSKILGISRPTLLQKIKQYNLNKLQNSF